MILDKLLYFSASSLVKFWGGGGVIRESAWEGSCEEGGNAWGMMGMLPRAEQVLS